MTLASTKRPKIMRWLSPLLLVSLGLHGLGLFVPMPREAEVLEEVEELTLDSIQVSVLPAESLPSVPAETVLVEELPEPPPTVAPPTAAPPPVAEPLPADPAEEPPLVSPQIEPDSAPADNQDLIVNSNEQTEQTALESDKPPKADLSTPQQYDPEGTQGSYDRFFAMTTQIDESLVPEFVRRDTYELDYLGNECFEETESVKSIVGVVIEDMSGRPQIVEGDIIQRTGYGKTDAAVQAWLDNLKEGGEGEGPSLKMESAFGESVYSWIFEQKNRVWFIDKAYESYYFGLVVNLVNNAC